MYLQDSVINTLVNESTEACIPSYLTRIELALKSDRDRVDLCIARGAILVIIVVFDRDAQRLGKLAGRNQPLAAIVGNIGKVWLCKGRKFK